MDKHAADNNKCRLDDLLTPFRLGSEHDSEDGASTFPRIPDSFLAVYTASHAREYSSS
jgi:hypothetical protein